MWQDQFPLIKNLSDQANGILIVLSENPKNEHVAAALALTNSLLSLGKNVIAVSPTDLKTRSELQSLPSLELVKDQVANKDLDVVFDYDESAVDKVSYHIDEANQKFHLVIQPKRGFLPLNTDSVQFQYSGSAADLIITVGADSLENLVSFFPELSELSETANVIAINPYESTFGTIKLDSSGLTGVTELIAALCQHLNASLDSQTSTLLLAGIEEASRGFSSPSMTADTFQLIATLLKAGGSRIKISKNIPAPSGSTGGFAAALGKRANVGATPIVNLHVPTQSFDQSEPATPAISKKRPVLGPLTQASPEAKQPEDGKKKSQKPDIQQLSREGSRGG